MHVCELDRPWEGTPFPFQGFTIKTPEEISILRECCAIVFIDLEKTAAIKDSYLTLQPQEGEGPLKDMPRISHTAATTNSLKYKQAHKVSSLLKKDLLPSRQTYMVTNKLIMDTMGKISRGESFDVPLIKEAVAVCVEKTIQHTDAMMMLTRLRHKDRYTTEHSLNVSIICIAFGLYLGLEKRALFEVGLSGLLHDIGKTYTPDSVLNKPDRLTSSEMAVMRRHPVDGRDILLSHGEVPDSVIDAVYCHHERIDGGGYPRGVGSDYLSLYSRMLSIVDTFDAITGDRVYSKGETNEYALNALHKSSGSAYDSTLVNQFTGNIGIYPLGSLVEMQNGEAGIVTETNHDHRLRPKVKLILDQNKVPQPLRHIDLSIPDRDANGVPYRIKCSHNKSEFNIDLNEHLWLGMAS